MKLSELMEESGFLKTGYRLAVQTVKEERNAILYKQIFYHPSGITCRVKGNTTFYPQDYFTVDLNKTYSEICSSIGCYQEEIYCEFALKDDLVAKLTIKNASETLHDQINATYPNKALGIILGEDYVPALGPYGSWFEIEDGEVNQEGTEKSASMKIVLKSRIDWSSLGYELMGTYGNNSYQKTFYDSVGHYQTVYVFGEEEVGNTVTVQITNKVEYRLKEWPAEAIAEMMVDDVTVPAIRDDKARFEWDINNDLLVYHYSASTYNQAVLDAGYILTVSTDDSAVYRIYTPQYIYSIGITDLGYCFKASFSRSEVNPVYFYLEDSAATDPTTQYHEMTIGYDKENYKGTYYAIEWTLEPNDCFAVVNDIGGTTRYGVNRTTFHDDTESLFTSEGDLLKYVGTSSMTIRMIIETYLNRCHIYAA